MQVLRMNKLFMFPLIFRCYGTQRLHPNYYEILEVPPDCSQKEIRRAFIALSKKWHPDIVGNKGHNQFVKVQEAYNVLSKESTRRQYDQNLRYNIHSPFSSPYVRREYPSHYEHIYRSRRKWEEHMARGNWQAGSNNIKHGHKILKYLFIFWATMGLIQILLFEYRMIGVRKNWQYEYQNNYNLQRKHIQGLTLEEQMNIVQNRYDSAHGKNKEEVEKQKE